MRIFLPGATGALGSRLVPQLVAAGHTVVGTTRHDSRPPAARDRRRAVRARPARRRRGAGRGRGRAPDVLVHELTALAGLGNRVRSPRSSPRPTGGAPRARTCCSPRDGRPGCAGWSRRATAAGRTRGPAVRSRPRRPARPDPGADAAAGAGRDPAPGGGRDRVRRGPRAAVRRLLRPRHLARPGGVHVGVVRARKFPIVGAGAGIVVLPHRRRGLGHRGGDRARRARRLQRRRRRARPGPGVAAGAGRRARRAPAPARAGLAGPAAGRRAGMVMMPSARGMSSAKAKRELDWAPAYPSWRDGFRDLGAASVTERAAHGRAQG